MLPAAATRQQPSRATPSPLPLLLLLLLTFLLVAVRGGEALEASESPEPLAGFPVASDPSAPGDAEASGVPAAPEFSIPAEPSPPADSESGAFESPAADADADADADVDVLPAAPAPGLPFLPSSPSSPSLPPSPSPVSAAAVASPTSPTSPPSPPPLSSSLPPAAGDACIAADALAHLPARALVFATHRAAHEVLCDAAGSCATPGHVVVLRGAPMTMRAYCARMRDAACTVRRDVLVNSPRLSRGVRVASRTDGLAFTALAARWETRLEVLAVTLLARAGF